VVRARHGSGCDAIRLSVRARDEAKAIRAHPKRTAPHFVQIEQLHLVVPALKSMLASKRTALERSGISRLAAN
jgi:hypothetical protein